VDAAKSSFCKEVECRGGEIKRGQRTASAAIHDSNQDTLSFIRGENLFAADGVVVWVDAVITRVRIKEQFANSDDVVRCCVCDAAGSEASGEEGTIASLGAR